MSDRANQIREAVNHEISVIRVTGTQRVMADAALAYADLIENPMPWCFEHGHPVVETPDGPLCTWFIHESQRGPGLRPCDIALATRPERIDSE